MPTDDQGSANQLALWRRVVRLTHPSLNTTDKSTLVMLMSFADPDGSNAFPSPETLADLVRCTPKTVRRALIRLQRGGWIRQSGRKSGRSSAGLRVWQITVDSKGNPSQPGPLAGIKSPSQWDAEAQSVGRGGPVTGTYCPTDRDAEAHSLGLHDHRPTHRPIHDLSMTSQGPEGVPPTGPAWSDGAPVSEQQPAARPAAKNEARSADMSPISKPSPETVDAESSIASSTTSRGDEWAELFVLLTAALLYAPERLARIDPLRPPSVAEVRRWLDERMPVGASRLCGQDDSARRIAERFRSDRERLLNAYRLKAGGGGLKANRGGPGRLFRWWLDKGIPEAVDNAQHAKALRRQQAVGSTSCNAAWENRGPVKPMDFDPTWEVRP